jgi:hypothetical protein
VPEVVLDRSRVLTIVGQLVPAAVAQHVAGDQEREFRRLPGARHHPLIAGHTLSGAFGHKDVDRPLALGCLTLQATQGT